MFLLGRCYSKLRQDFSLCPLSTHSPTLPLCLSLSTPLQQFNIRHAHGPSNITKGRQWGYQRAPSRAEGCA